MDHHATGPYFIDELLQGCGNSVADALALSYYSDLTLSQAFQPMTAQISKQAALPLHEPRIFYPSGHWPETVTNAHVSAHFR